MSSFDNFYTRLQSLNEARKSPVEALVPGATGVTKQMRSAGLSSAPLDTIRFIRELLFNLDVISEEELNVVKMGKGFTGKKQAMLKVLQDNQDAINAKSDEIAQRIESTLDDFISGMGANRSREEKYAAQAAAEELAAQARAAKSGKEMDDALADVISDEKLIIKASLAKAIQELEDLPGGEDISPEVLAEIKKFAPKINTIEQLESFVKQLSAMEEYQLPAAYLSSTVKAIKGGMEDIEMEDQEDPDHGFDANKSDLDGNDKISEYERKRGEAIASSMSKEDNEYGEAETVGFAELGLNRTLIGAMYEDEYGAFNRAEFPNLDIGSLKKMIANRFALKPDIGISGRLAQMEKQISGLDDAVVVSFSEDGENAEDPDIEALAQVEVEEIGDGELPDDYHDQDYEDAEGAAKFELAASGGRGSQVTGASQSFNSLEEVCAAAGVDPSECANAELWDDMGDGTKEFQVDEDNVIIMHAHAEDEDGEHSPVQKCVAAIDALAAGGSDVESCTAAIDQLAATLEGDEKVAAYEDLRDYMKGSLSHADSYEDLNDYLNARLGQSEVEDAEEADMKQVAESKYTTADYLTDIYSSVEPIVESTVNENGQTTPTRQYLVETYEAAIEDAYTSQYLTEQKTQDALPKQKKEKSLSFKERFQPKTQWQLEEVRRYGL